MAKHLTRVTIGFHSEADFAFTHKHESLLLRLPQISPKITVVDFANTAFGKPCPFPITKDDEGITAKDAYIIKDGRVTQLLTNRRVSARMKLPLTGNARIPKEGEPPQIYMRNVAFMPGTDTFEDMLATMGNGYYLVDGFDAGGDTNGDYACRILEGYHVRDGVICEPIQDCAVWGFGADLLKSITMVGSDFKWFTDTFEERPLAPQAFGAPTINARVNIGQW